MIQPQILQNAQHVDQKHYSTRDTQRREVWLNVDLAHADAAQIGPRVLTP